MKLWNGTETTPDEDREFARQKHNGQPLGRVARMDQRTMEFLARRAGKTVKEVLS